MATTEPHPVHIKTTTQHEEIRGGEREPLTPPREHSPERQGREGGSSQSMTSQAIDTGKAAGRSVKDRADQLQRGARETGEGLKNRAREGAGKMGEVFEAGQERVFETGRRGMEMAGEAMDRTKELAKGRMEGFTDVALNVGALALDVTKGLMRLGWNVTAGTVEMARTTSMSVMRKSYEVSTFLLPMPIKTRLDSVVGYGRKAMRQPVSQTAQEIQPMVREQASMAREKVQQVTERARTDPRGLAREAIPDPLVNFWNRMLDFAASVTRMTSDRLYYLKIQKKMD